MNSTHPSRRTHLRGRLLLLALATAGCLAPSTPAAWANEGGNTPRAKPETLAERLQRLGQDAVQAAASAARQGLPAAPQPDAPRPTRVSPSTSGAALDGDEPASSPSGHQPMLPPEVMAAKDVELVEIRPGMSARDAADALAKRYPSAVHTVVKGRWEKPIKAEFTAGLLVVDAKQRYPWGSRGIERGEVVQVFLSAPPGPPTVIGLQRTVIFPNSQASHMDEWAKALERKYGVPAVPLKIVGHSEESIVWVFDKGRPNDPKAIHGPTSKRCVNPWGKLGLDPRESFDQRMLASVRDGGVTRVFEDVQRRAVQAQDSAGYCGRMLHVTLERAEPEKDPVSRLTRLVNLLLIDQDRAAVAGSKTQAMLETAARQAEDRKVDQARQTKPTL